MPPAVAGGAPALFEPVASTVGLEGLIFARGGDATEPGTVTGGGGALMPLPLPRTGPDSTQTEIKRPSNHPPLPYFKRNTGK